MSSAGSSFLAMMSLQVGFRETISKRRRQVKQIEFIEQNFKGMRIQSVRKGSVEIGNTVPENAVGGVKALSGNTANDDNFQNDCTGNCNR